MKLNELAVGKSAAILRVGGKGALRQHFLDMGMIPGAEVTVIKLAPMGDPMELQIHGYELTLRLAEAEQIEIKPIQKIKSRYKDTERIKASEHPGLGEDGKYHSKAEENPLPDGTKLTYALVGNQNCGKTTLFNQITGAKQHVGNFPGVTVDRKDGMIRGYPNTEVTDLPGIYSMSPFSSEEIVSRNFVLNDKPKAIINIVDATNIERNLYLTMQLLEMNVPMVVALNMMDEVVGNQGSIDVNAMEAMLGVPVIPISAAKNEGVDELIKPRYILQSIRNDRLNRIFATRTTITVQSTDVFMPLFILLRIMLQMPSCLCALPQQRQSRAIRLFLTSSSLIKTSMNCLNTLFSRWRLSAVLTEARQ